MPSLYEDCDENAYVNPSMFLRKCMRNSELEHEN